MKVSKTSDGNSVGGLGGCDWIRYVEGRYGLVRGQSYRAAPYGIVYYSR